MVHVSLVSTSDRKKGVEKAINLLGINPVEDKEVILKPNFNTADPPPASTSMETLYTLVEKLKYLGAKSITIAERSGPANTEETFTTKGLYKLAKELNVNIVNLAELPLEGYVHVTPENSHWKNGFLFAKLFHNAECIVETMCLKTHKFGGHFTLSLKNAVGLVPRRNLDGNSYMTELHGSKNQRKMIAEINTVYKPDLLVMDGVKTFIDGGPMEGTMKEANVILASTDKVAMDAVGVAILRIFGTTPDVEKGSIFDQEQIKRAVELGIGDVTKPEDIELIFDQEETDSFNLAEKIRQKLLE